MASSRLAERVPEMCGMATLTMEVSSASMKVARVTVMAMTQGLALGRHVSWKVRVAAAKTASLIDGYWLVLVVVRLTVSAGVWLRLRSFLIDDE